MGKTTGFLEWQRESPPKRRQRPGPARHAGVHPPAVRGAEPPAGRPLHGLRHSLLSPGLPAGEPHSRLQRPRLARALGGGVGRALLDQRLPRVHRAPLPRAVRGGVRAGHRPGAGHHRADREGDRRPRLPRGLGAPADARRRGPERRWRSSAAVRRGSPRRRGSTAPGTPVTVYERAPAPGGLLRFGIPDFKLEKSLVERRVALLEAEGVNFRCGVDVGTRRASTSSPPSTTRWCWPSARGGHGTWSSPAGSSPAWSGRWTSSRRRTGTWAARRSRPRPLGGRASGWSSSVAATPARTASAPRTGRRRRRRADRAAAGASEQPRGRELWPDWPLVFRTSSSQEEGGERAVRTLDHPAHRAERAARGDGARHGVELERGRGRSEPPHHRRRHPRRLRQVDLLVLAMGFLGPETAALRVAARRWSWTGAATSGSTGRFRTSVPACGRWATPGAERASSCGRSPTGARQHGTSTRS